MKKIISVLLIILIISILALPIDAIGSPRLYGSYMTPPNQTPDAYTASYQLMRSYAEVYSVLINSSIRSDVALVSDAPVDAYLTAMISSPNIMVVPSNDGFGQFLDYVSISGIRSQYACFDMSESGFIYSTPGAKYNTEFVVDGQRGNSLLYSYDFRNATCFTACQYGTITGEWINSTSVHDIVTGYAIKWGGNGDWTVNLKGNLIYGVDGRIVKNVNIDRNYSIPSGETFQFNPQTLLQYEDTINFDYYVFTGNWTVHSANAGNIIEYKAYDSVNVETVDYLNGYNEYTDQIYSVDLNPITRIVSKLSTSVQTPTGTLRRTLTENGTFTYDVSQYAEVEINTDVPQEILQDVNAFNWLFGAVNGFLQMEILPGFSLGGIVLFIAGLALLIWILKIFLGG